MKKNQHTIAIVTPTYNRAYILEQLYQSLVRQTNRDFYWLIVDDGSTDNTENIVKQWMQDEKVDIEYYKQENSGKASAINMALDVVKGELFFCVDSDDYLADDSIQKIMECYQDLSEEHIGILAARKNYKTNKAITKFYGTKEYGKLKNLYDEKEISGDTALIYRTDIISKYRFPIFEKERFVPEAYLYDLLDQEGTLLLMKKQIYFCDYLDDGYTSKMKKIIYENPNGYYAYISQRIMFDKNNKNIFFDNIRCISINIVRKQKNILVGTRKKWINLIALPLAILYYICTFYKYTK